jgi:hypothetical protein
MISLKEIYEIYTHCLVKSPAIPPNERAYVAGYSELGNFLICGLDSNFGISRKASLFESAVVNYGYKSYWHIPLNLVRRIAGIKIEDLKVMRELEVIPPEGYEIDKENSAFDRIVFRKKDNNAFKKGLSCIETIATFDHFNKVLFNKDYDEAGVIQLLDNSCPNDRPELRRKAFYIHEDYNVEVGKILDGTFISITKKE